MTNPRPTICLNMIVKDETAVIRRCLDSVRPIIDYWVIVDTGSSDGTQDMIRRHFADLPGELHERPWKNFGHNRSEALELARGKGDYSFVMDADAVLKLDPGFAMPPLTADSYDALILYSGILYHRKQFMRSALPWRYEGVLHEYPVCEAAVSEGFIPGLTTVMHTDGARAKDPNRFRRDAEILEAALREKPDEPRNVFYLAQSYRDAGNISKAIETYRRRAALGGWIEEAWYSLYQIGVLQARIGTNWPEAMATLLSAWQHTPQRAEPLFQIGMYYQHKREFHAAHPFLAEAMRVPTPDTRRLFVETSLYDYLIKLEYAVTCYWTGRHKEAIALNDELLASPLLPENLRQRVIDNRKFSLDLVGR